MGKKLLLLFIAIGILAFLFLTIVKSGSTTKSSSVSVWQQMKRRLLDDDVPQEKEKTSKQFDMTNI